MSRDIVPLGLRMPAEIRGRIEAAAKANGRSMNAEILQRLTESFRIGVQGGRDSSPVSATNEQLLTELARRLNEKA